MYVCMYAHVYVYAHLCMYIRMHLFEFLSGYSDACMYVRMYVCKIDLIFTVRDMKCMHVSINVCMNIFSPPEI